jgi:FtsZ-binding cell division protein ZapB
MRVEQHLEQIVRFFEDCKRVPLTGKLLVDEDTLLELIEQMIRDLPVEVQSAKELYARRDQFVAEAEREAEALRANAERERLRMISETEIYRQASVEADRLIRDTHIHVHEQQMSADQYADNVLADLEAKIGRALQTIKNGRQELSGIR